MGGYAKKPAAAQPLTSATQANHAPKPKPSKAAPSGAASIQLKGQQNPTYTDARSYAETLFRRQGEMVVLMSNAARDGLTAFSLRSSEAYNHVDSIGLALFEIALAAFPAASAFAGALAEMKSAKNSLALISKLKSISDRAEKIHHGLEKVEPIVKAVEAAKDLGHSIGEVAESREIQTETQEKAEFQIETLSTLRELTEAGTASRWAREDLVAAAMELVEYSDPSIDLKEIVRNALGPLPAPGDLALLKPVATQFEMKLYVNYYLETGRVTRHVVSVDGAERVDWEGIPPAVLERFSETGQFDVLMNHPNLKHTYRDQIAAAYMGHRF